MPRQPRIDIADHFYHIINRANGRLQIFNTPDDYLLFESLLVEARALTDMRILAYVIMPNHWHLMLQPRKDKDISVFMHWLSTTHTRKVHIATDTVGAGHLYQERYKSFLVDSDNYLLSVIKYIERNPVRARLVEKCEDWQWGSALKRVQRNPDTFVSDPPMILPQQYVIWINTEDRKEELISLRQSVNKGVPYGRTSWVEVMARQYKLESSLREPGRPKKN